MLIYPAILADEQRFEVTQGKLLGKAGTLYISHDNEEDGKEGLRAVSGEGHLNGKNHPPKEASTSVRASILLVFQ